MQALASFAPNDLAELGLSNEGQVINERYRVVRELGRGGMGSVLAAHDMLLGRDVALKVLLPHLAASPEFRSRFESEARSLAGIDTPHVVRVLDYGVVFSPGKSGLPFIVLELLRGEDLLSVASREGPLDPQRMVGYMLQACAGLSAAHHLGIVHRDLKPENLFLASDQDGSQCLKILDFGVARSRHRRVHTQAGVGVGSPGYMAPEQVLSATKSLRRAAPPPRSPKQT
jgi:serine/threonine-protein kinase